MSLSKNEKSVFFRDIKEKDIIDLFEFLNELDNNTKRFFHPHSFDMETITDICKSKKDHYFVMFLDNTLIGYSFLRLFGYETPSFGCCIRNGYEHKGYGTIITKLTIEKAKELGYNKIILKTYKENISAQKIYKKLGFKAIGETEDGKQYKMELNL